jgi:hypothetical protein
MTEDKMKGTCHCGKVSWPLHTPTESVTACNCTIGRRYGALWAYGYLRHDIPISGETHQYRRSDGGAIAFHVCSNCGSTTHYVAVKPGEDGRHWSAVNLRLTEPELVAKLPIDHFDGLDSFHDLPRDGRCVSDLWF